MQNQTIENIYAANDQIHETFKATIKDVSEERATKVLEGEKWTVAALVEHLSMVGGAMTQICAKLLSQAAADDDKHDGTLKISDNFREKSAQIVDLKLEAPKTLEPTGKQTLADSLAKMDENFAALEKLRPLFASVESDKNTFPHPFLGELTAHEWLLLVGRHEQRHLPQLNKMLEKSAVG